ncbi:hypothetical protein FPQ18DRAFT_387064 [Pyronema domesticum]|nr:hypothetical protein FPQ18DRAFT_387064 [Pyronema domesticum]
MSSENSYEQSIYSSTQASTPGFDTPMSPTPTANLQISSPAYENMFRSFQDTFASLRAEMARLEIENKRLNVKLSGANDDALKKLAEVEEEKAGLQKELSGFEGLRDVLGWKKATENQERMEELLENY